ncbi:DUF2567 domain-containing protein [Nocardia cyriacigeorgica]|uniref:DUF2567 domain-containing protein n=1 Tax=Nocardia cyriacigeorgica TaxID=135487 RepID=A0A6P1CQ24_9NOCA|nr:DUF2567 domain-containing protein [Nocardia cyriacigeorgica]MBF6084179.1 DUF2567 domain-containing protein [Nocardia cyriacigeorgica]MBF6286797.1 DUF2567 domain-containing protein [Nocardia cyriacigeorgica]MBF6426693.1 DUF2567 domain-containing protein [Nocardia cyriacigeorgica]NEW32275.1 DUF2567 domain-containing protein [Nocardia cyriacigeorgica]BDT86359.1 hypothetical protein FMUAM8_21230 [Nocardia cyriacigeorgica]
MGGANAQVHPETGDPGVAVRREVGAAGVIAAAVIVANLIGAVVWGLLAPAEQLLVVQPGRGAPLTGESAHRFDAVAIFVCIGAVIGLLAAVGAWRWRRVRGPIAYAGLLFGSVAGGYLMAWLGEYIAEANHPRPDDPPVGQIVALPPEVGTWMALVPQPLIASLVVLFLAALSTSEDLGTGYAGPLGGSRPVTADGYDPALVYDPYGQVPVGYGSAPQAVAPPQQQAPQPGVLPERDSTN